MPVSGSRSLKYDSHGSTFAPGTRPIRTHSDLSIKGGCSVADQSPLQRKNAQLESKAYTGT